MTTKLFPELAQILCRTLGDVLTPADSLDELMHDEGVFEFPYAPAGFATPRVEGRAAVRDYLAKAAASIAIEKISTGQVMVAADQAMLELHMQGHRRSDGLAYDQTYVAVLRLDQGRIRHYRDYWNPLPVVEAAQSGALA